MSIIHIYKKTGILAKPQQVKIIDLRQPEFIFYDYDFSDREISFFNLPYGIYEIDFPFKQVRPKQHVLPPLPAPEAHRPDPKSFKLVFETNPHKATVDFNKRMIIVDPGYLKKPKVCLTYTIGHEIGHKIYLNSKQSEANADLYAMYYMIDKGFNKSQIQDAIDWSLDKPTSDYRKNAMYDNLINIKSECDE
jgi:hypothetical protein